MSLKYKNLLSPVKIGNVILRNRMYCSPSSPIFLQGSETYPTKPMMEIYANKAKSGAAIVTVGGGLPRGSMEGTVSEHIPHLDHEDPKNYGYYSQLTQLIHFHGALASLQVKPADVYGWEWDVSDGVASPTPKNANFEQTLGKEMPKEMIPGLVEQYAQQAVVAKMEGFDMVYIHCCYYFFVISRFLSKRTNKRTDEFGGPMENRARFLLMVCKRIKELCGKDFLIEVSVTGYEPDGGNTVEDIIELTKLADGLVDIFQIRPDNHGWGEPNGFDKRGKTPYLKYAAEIKASNPPMLIAANAGFLDLDFCEEVIAEGKADLIAGARPWISNSDYGKKAYEGRGEDVVPCIRCARCHIPDNKNPHVTVCSVNPTYGSISDKLPTNVSEPGESKKVAVIGGGPAGMEAALVAAQRGHKVTLFEKTDKLGGLLKHSDFVSFKWPLKDFKDYMIRQVNKEENIEICMQTDATPEMLEGKGYDQVIVAIGSKPSKPPIPGINRENVSIATEVFGHEEEMPKNIVVIGGGEVGVDVGLYLAEAGHKVFVIEALAELCADATPSHYREQMDYRYENEENFSYVVNARCSEVKEHSVTYTDGEGNCCEVEADSVIVALGLKPRIDEGFAFYGKAPKTTLIGDCKTVANVQKAMFTAYSTAVTI